MIKGQRVQKFIALTTIYSLQPTLIS